MSPHSSYTVCLESVNLQRELSVWVENIGRTKATSDGYSSSEICASIEQLYRNALIDPLDSQRIIVAESPLKANEIACQREWESIRLHLPSCTEVCNTIADTSLRNTYNQMCKVIGFEPDIPSFREARLRTSVYSEAVVRESCLFQDHGRVRPILGNLYLGSLPLNSYLSNELGNITSLRGLNAMLWLCRNFGFIYFGATYCVLTELPTYFEPRPSVNEPSSFEIVWQDGFLVSWENNSES